LHPAFLGGDRSTTSRLITWNFSGAALHTGRDHRIRPFTV